MNTKILDQLTFGFEIEGVFTKGMHKKLGNKGVFKQDGSVHRLDASLLPNKKAQGTSSLIWPEIRECADRRTGCNYINNGGQRIITNYCDEHDHLEGEVYEGSTATEYASGIYQNFDEMLKDIELFTGGKYIYNNTCGLHLHVGIKEQSKRIQEVQKRGFGINQVTGTLSEQIITEKKEEFTQNWKKLYQTAQNWELQSLLWGQALAYCQHQKERLTDNDRYRWCKVYPTKQHMINAANGNNIKYSFMNFHHGYKTLEFRFLVPCDCKVENIVMLMETLTTFLGKDKKENFYRVGDRDISTPVKENLQIDKKIYTPVKEVMRIKKRLFSQLPYVLVRKIGRNKYKGYIYNEMVREHTGTILLPWQIGKLEDNFKESSIGNELYLPYLVGMPKYREHTSTNTKWHLVSSPMSSIIN